MTAGTLQIRAVSSDDLPLFFEMQLDAEANRMAAFVGQDPSDRSAFDAHWDRLLAAPDITTRTIVLEGDVVGHVTRYIEDGHPEVTYWIAREHWGKGIATRALAALLDALPDRPVYARAAKDNEASLRVLAKCGFTIVGHDRGFANARGEEIDEVVLELR